MRESYLTRAKLVLGDLEIEGQTVPGLNITLFFDRKQPLKYKTQMRLGRRKLY